jgi:hypothetical protein
MEVGADPRSAPTSMAVWGTYMHYVLLLALATLTLSVPCSSEAVTINKKHLNNGITCINCHEEAAPHKAAKAASCITCHTETPGSAKTYLDQGNQRSVNMHASHEGSVRCTLCHGIHKESRLYCNDCHKFEVTVP